MGGGGGRQERGEGNEDEVGAEGEGTGAGRQETGWAAHTQPPEGLMLRPRLQPDQAPAPTPLETQGTEEHPLRMESAWPRARASQLDKGPGFFNKNGEGQGL